MKGDTTVFHTRAGVLIANKVFSYNEFVENPKDKASPNFQERRKKPSSLGSVVELDFPLEAIVDCDEASLLLEALGGVEVKWVGRSNSG